MKRALIILSGGLDSTVLAHDILARGEKQLAAVSFDYGQKHTRELECAARQAALLGIEHQTIALPFIGELFDSALLKKGDELPKGHYEDDNMKQTVVPNRNMIMLSIATGIAISQQRTELFYGAHGGDHAIYPDCRPDFVEAMKSALQLCDWQKIKLHVPYLQDDKAKIVKHGLNLGVDFAQTWTCYAGGAHPCGKCGSCVERAQAFALNKVKDPLLTSQ
ncbi:MAG: 7-cyano-7-deazaguanine synthase QueC [Hyphomicrobiaceae bacterium]|nr:7-cyano-7-deazaguanine synthase QueC [Hyphomicrobiaceae bacterium]